MRYVSNALDNIRATSQRRSPKANAKWELSLTIYLSLSILNTFSSCSLPFAGQKRRDARHIDVHRCCEMAELSHQLHIFYELPLTTFNSFFACLTAGMTDGRVVEKHAKTKRHTKKNYSSSHTYTCTHTHTPGTNPHTRSTPEKPSTEPSINVNATDWLTGDFFRLFSYFSSFLFFYYLFVWKIWRRVYRLLRSMTCENFR